MIVLTGDVIHIIGLLAMNAIKPDMIGVRASIPIIVKTVVQLLITVSITSLQDKK